MLLLRCFCLCLVICFGCFACNLIINGLIPVFEWLVLSLTVVFECLLGFNCDLVVGWLFDCFDVGCRVGLLCLVGLSCFVLVVGLVFLFAGCD